MEAGFPRPVVVVSQCLELDACRYNGGVVRAPFVKELAQYASLRPICPELAIGLGVPRDPIEIVLRDGARRLVQPGTGRDLTEAMERFAEEFLGSLDEPDGFILKSRSPSCGITDTKIFGSDPASGPVSAGAGFFAGAVLARFPHAAVEDEARLWDAGARHRFLVRLFLRAAFREVRARPGGGRLVAFHGRYRRLFAETDPVATQSLDRLVARPLPDLPESVLANYEAIVAPLLERVAGRAPQDLVALPYPADLCAGARPQPSG